MTMTAIMIIVTVLLRVKVSATTICVSTTMDVVGDGDGRSGNCDGVENNNNNKSGHVGSCFVCNDSDTIGGDGGGVTGDSTSRVGHTSDCRDTHIDNDYVGNGGDGGGVVSRRSDGKGGGAWEGGIGINVGGSSSRVSDVSDGYLLCNNGNMAAGDDTINWWWCNNYDWYVDVGVQRDG